MTSLLPALFRNLKLEDTCTNLLSNCPVSTKVSAFKWKNRNVMWLLPRQPPRSILAEQFLLCRKFLWNIVLVGVRLAPLYYYKTFVDPDFVFRPTLNKLWPMGKPFRKTFSTCSRELEHRFQQQPTQLAGPFACIPNPNLWFNRFIPLCALTRGWLLCFFKAVN